MDLLNIESPPSSPTIFPDILSSPETLDQVYDLCSKLPVENYCLLAMLSAHLSKVVANKDENKMSISNLQVVFSPTLFVPLFFNYSGISSHLLHVFVFNHLSLFPPRTEETLNSLPVMGFLGVPEKASYERSREASNATSDGGLLAITPEERSGDEEDGPVLPDKEGPLFVVKEEGPPKPERSASPERRPLKPARSMDSLSKK